MRVSSLPKDWIAAPFVSLLFQNLICEERADIREASLSAWEMSMKILSESETLMETTITQKLILDWYAIMMTPIGLPVDTTNFYHPSVAVTGGVAPERHNVDKNMLAQDMSLVSSEETFRARIAAATAMAYLLTYWNAKVCPIFSLTKTN